MPKLTVEDRLQREIDAVDAKLLKNNVQREELAGERARLLKALEALKTPGPEKSA